MTVYVDHAENLFGRMRMCHMMADTEEELHAMAARIGLKREWFQPQSSPHYDVSKEKRALAVKYGAKEVNRRELVVVIQRLRSERLAKAICTAPVGDRGQRYEVQAIDGKGNKFTVGWCGTLEGIATFRTAVAMHPSWHSPSVIDRETGEIKESP